MENQRPLKHRMEYVEDLIKQHNYTSFAEIGCGGGHVSKHLLENCPSLKQVILLDIEDRIIFHDFFDKFPFVTFYNESSVDVSKKIEDNSLDIVYIDADHTYEHCLEDIKCWQPKVKKGGILCGHDYGTFFWKGVKQAVDESFPIGLNLLLESDLYGQPEPKDYIWWVYVN